MRIQPKAPVTVNIKINYYIVSTLRFFEIIYIIYFRK